MVVTQWVHAIRIALSQRYWARFDRDSNQIEGEHDRLSLEAHCALEHKEFLTPIRLPACSSPNMLDFLLPYFCLDDRSRGECLAMYLGNTPSSITSNYRILMTWPHVLHRTVTVDFVKGERQVLSMSCRAQREEAEAEARAERERVEAEAEERAAQQRALTAQEWADHVARRAQREEAEAREAQRRAREEEEHRMQLVLGEDEEPENANPPYQLDCPHYSLIVPRPGQLGRGLAGPG